MRMGKRLILTGWVPGNSGYEKELLAMPVIACGNTGSFDYKTASLARGCFSAQDDNLLDLQLFSLLARFQLISSPMVELVLETGCL
jgi:hypothetical protein